MSTKDVNNIPAPSFQYSKLKTFAAIAVISVIGLIVGACIGINIHNSQGKNYCLSGGGIGIAVGFVAGVLLDQYLRYRARKKQREEKPKNTPNAQTSTPTPSDQTQPVTSVQIVNNRPRDSAKDLNLPSVLLAACADFLDDGDVAIFRRICKTNQQDRELLVHFARRLTLNITDDPRSMIVHFGKQMRRIQPHLSKINFRNLRQMINGKIQPNTSNFVIFFHQIDDFTKLRHSWGFIAPFLMNPDKPTPIVENRSYLSAEHLARLRGYQLQNIFSKAFITAAQWGDIPFARLLLSHGVDVHTEGGFYYNSAINEAAELGNLEYVKFLLGASADINCQRAPFRRTPVYYAAREGHLPLVKYLLANNADIHRTGNDKILCQCRNDEVFELLLTHPQTTHQDIVAARSSSFKASQVRYAQEGEFERGHKSRSYRRYERLTQELSSRAQKKLQRQK